MIPTFMRRALLLFIVTFSVNYSTDAQWYYRTCNVTDINTCTHEEFECLWGTAKQNVIGGAISTAIGTGIWVYAYIREVYYFQPGDLSGIYTIPAGLIFNMIGISNLIIGAVRRNELRNTTYYKNLNSSCLKISPSIKRNHFTNTYSIGITASLRF